jgi:hypothetical protein
MRKEIYVKYLRRVSVFLVHKGILYILIEALHNITCRSMV